MDLKACKILFFQLQIFKQALQKMEENGCRNVQNIDVDIGLVYWWVPLQWSVECTVHFAIHPLPFQVKMHTITSSLDQ
jgi:hypothetical protein